MFPVDSIKVSISESLIIPHTRRSRVRQPAGIQFPAASPHAPYLSHIPYRSLSNFLSLTSLSHCGNDYFSQTRMQVFTAASSGSTYTGVVNAFSRISSTEGLRTLWRGVASVIMGAGPAHAVHFGMYEFVKDLAGGNQAGHHPFATCMYRPAKSVCHRLY